MSHEKDCSVCNGIDLSLSNPENARALGVSERTVRRHKAALKARTDPFFTDVPVAWMTSRGKTVRLPDGSYEKVTFNPRIAALTQSSSYEDLERVIESFPRHTTPQLSEEHQDQAFVLCLADFQVGKAREALGGTTELIERIMRSLTKAQSKIETLKPRTIILVDLGDGIEGFSNVGSQAQTNDIDLTTQIRTFRRLMIEAIGRFAPMAPSVKYVAVPSNHCQVRAPGGKDLASTPDNDFGIEVSYQLEDVLAGRPEYSHVQFIRPQGNEEAVTFNSGTGTVLGAVHGHQSKSGPEKMGEWWKGQSHGRRSGLHEADILMFGHWHSLRVQQSGDSRWLFGAPTSDNGSSWYANKTGEVSQTGMLSFTTKNGEWSNLEIV